MDFTLLNALYGKKGTKYVGDIIWIVLNILYFLEKVEKGL